MTDMHKENKHSTTEVDSKAVRVLAGARLHFGLLDSAVPFGGVGVMVDQPKTAITVRAADEFSCPEEHCERFREIASGVSVLLNRKKLPALRIEVESNPEAHCGLGSGTQLSLAAAESMLQWFNHSYDETHLALAVADRGKRSAVGIHGYFKGGMIFEAPGSDPEELNPIQERIDLPVEWCVAILKPSTVLGQVFGLSEAEKFSTLSAGSEALRDSLFLLAQNQLLPAAKQHHFEDFSRYLTQYNRMSGQLFASIQGGSYNGPEVTSLIHWLIDRGVLGVGQSSWGPGVFAWFKSYSHAETLVTRLPEGVEVLAITHPLNSPRSLSISPNGHFKV